MDETRRAIDLGDLVIVMPGVVYAPEYQVVKSVCANDGSVKWISVGCVGVVIAVLERESMALPSRVTIYEAKSKMKLVIATRMLERLF